MLCGFGLFGYFAAQSLKPTEDPAQVRNEANLIASVEVPPALEPKVAINFTMPFVNKKVFSVAVFADKAEHSSLVLFELASDIGDPNQMLNEFEKSMAESGQEDDINAKKLPVTDVEEIKSEVNGKPAVFEVGKAMEGERELWQASGRVQWQRGRRDADHAAQRRRFQQGRRDQRGQVDQVARWTIVKRRDPCAMDSLSGLDARSWY